MEGVIATSIKSIEYIADVECMVNQEVIENKILASIPNTGRVNGKPLSEGLYLGIE